MCRKLFLVRRSALTTNRRALSFMGNIFFTATSSCMFSTLASSQYIINTSSYKHHKVLGASLQILTEIPCAVYPRLLLLLIVGAVCSLASNFYARLLRRVDSYGQELNTYAVNCRNTFCKINLPYTVQCLHSCCDVGVASMSKNAAPGTTVLQYTVLG